MEVVLVKTAETFTGIGVLFLCKFPEYVMKQQGNAMLPKLHRIPMIVSQLLESSRKRVPWPTMRAIFKMCELPCGRGWEDTIKKLTEESNKNSNLVNNFNTLRKYYSDHLLTGEKALKIFAIDREKIDKAIERIKNYEVPIDVFHETYPFPLPDEKLAEIDSLPKLVEVGNSESQLSIIFCTKRFFTERTEINTEDLSNEAKSSLGMYDELVGIRKYDRQFFDAIILWKDRNLVEIRIDTSQGRMPSKERIRAFSEIIDRFNSLVKEETGINEMLKANINFFPLIDRLYESNEGKVGELAFTTDEGSIKSEKMRREKVDLRNELYHKAGRQAVDHITAYRLAILWRFQLSDDVETQPELLLPGQSRSLSHSIQNLDEVIITKCSGLQDYNFVFEKIIKYLHA
jgi:hypothetical protein